MRVELLCLLAAVLLALVLRLACLNGELWLDEIWSWQLAAQAGWPGGVFLLRHDNNHPLNTAWLTLWAADWPVWIYRLPALLAGLSAVVLSALALRQVLGAGRSPSWVIVAWLYAACWWLVLYSVEARGYSLAVACTLLALLALGEYFQHRQLWALGLFWLSSVLGFLSHLSFLHAYLGFVAWSARRFARDKRGFAWELRQLSLCHGPTAAFLLPFYLLCIRGMEIAGGPPDTPSAVVSRLISLGLGSPVEGWAMLPWLLTGVGLFLFGLRRLASEASDVWVFFAVAVVLAPGLFLLRPPPFLFERYFLIAFSLGLLVIATGMGSCWKSGRLGQAVVVLLLGIFLVGNGQRIKDFADAGRGQFHQALAYIAEQDDAPEVWIAGDHDPRVSRYLEFYRAALALPDRLRYLDQQALSKQAPEWLLVHRLDSRYPPQEHLTDASGRHYQLLRAYPARGPVDWGWFVYRRIAEQGS